MNPPQAVLVTECSGFALPLIGIQVRIQLVGGERVHLQRRGFQMNRVSIGLAIPQAHARKHPMPPLAHRLQHPPRVGTIDWLAKNLPVAVRHRIGSQHNASLVAVRNRSGLRDAGRLNKIGGGQTTIDFRLHRIVGRINGKRESMLSEQLMTAGRLAGEDHRGFRVGHCWLVMAGVCVTVFGMTPKLTILYEDNHLLVVDKPAPLPTMGASEGEDSLVNMAKDYLRVKYNKPGNVFLGVVSRLDSFVTGVVVLARTSKAASRLSEQFRSRSVEKTYWAIVADPLPGLAATLEHQVYKNESRHRMQAADMTIAAPADAKMARLSYRTLGTNGERTLIEVKLDTGRKHQIRVQLEAIGCPIVGDRKYGSEVTFKQGVALHSQQLAIDHPTSKERMTFQAPPPKWWRISRFSSSQ